MTDFWQGQHPWFALENLGRPGARDTVDRTRDDSSPQDRPAASTDQHPPRERADEFVQRSIQRTYDRS